MGLFLADTPARPAVAWSTSSWCSELGSWGLLLRKISQSPGEQVQGQVSWSVVVRQCGIWGTKFSHRSLPCCCRALLKDDQLLSFDLGAWGQELGGIFA